MGKGFGISNSHDTRVINYDTSLPYAIVDGKRLEFDLDNLKRILQATYSQDLSSVTYFNVTFQAINDSNFAVGYVCFALQLGIHDGTRITQNFTAGIIWDLTYNSITVQRDADYGDINEKGEILDINQKCILNIATGQKTELSKWCNYIAMNNDYVLRFPCYICDRTLKEKSMLTLITNKDAIGISPPMFDSFRVLDISARGDILAIQTNNNLYLLIRR